MERVQMLSCSDLFSYSPMKSLPLTCVENMLIIGIGTISKLSVEQFIATITHFLSFMFIS